MTEKQGIGGAVVKWYRSELDRDDGRARTACARLKRCQSTVEALAVEETFALNDRLKQVLQGFPTADQLALLATTFARLRGVEGDRLAAAFGKPKSQNGPRVLSELRFQSLIRVRSHRDLMPSLRRSLAVLGANPTCNGWELAEDLYFWSDQTRNRWCFQYFGANRAEANLGENVQ